MGDKPDFATNFHNLEGDLKGERKKSLFKLLRTERLFSNEKQLESALKNLKPTTYQESLFYIDTLLYFKRTNELLEILKEGNEIFASKILKQPWFFQAAFQEMNGDKLVNDILPCLSYSVRKNLVTRISHHWNEEKMDLLFNALDKKYGLIMSIPTLHKCTTGKIKSVIEENEILLRANQVAHLYDRSEDLFKLYLYHFNTTHGRYKEMKVINRIAKRNPKLLLELEKDNKITVHTIGKRTSKRIMDVVKDEISSDSERYLRILNNSVVIRKLGKKFELIYKQQLPKNFKHLNQYCTVNKLLKYYPKNRKWDLFMETCKEKFAGKNLDEILLQCENIKFLNPPKEMIFKWAELHYQIKVGNFKDYLNYYEPSKAINIIKERINLTSSSWERRSLVCLMITACEKNNDLNALEEVLKYICFRHRNEDALFRNEILSQLRLSFKLEDFNENHWKYINEQLKIVKIQKQRYSLDIVNFLKKQLEFLIKNEKDHKATLIDYVNDAIEGNFINRRLDLKNLPVEKQIYTEILTILSETPDFKIHVSSFLTIILTFSVNNPEYCIKLTDFADVVALIQYSCAKTNNFDKGDLEIITNIMLYNHKFPNYAVPDNADIVKIIHYVTHQEKTLGRFLPFLNSILTKNERSDSVNKILAFYLEDLFEKFPYQPIVSWFIHNEPKTLAPYITKIVRNGAEIYDRSDYQIIKHYSHLGFDKTIIALHKNQLDYPEGLIGKRLLDALRILLSTDDFLTLVNERYLPKKDKLDLEDNEMQAVYKLQCEVAGMLGKVIEPHKMLPTIMKFCRGDYLQSALASLYRVFYRSPEKILYSYVEALLKQAVSVRKHAIFLTCEVLDKKHTLELLISTSESNVSSCKHLFSATLKYFLKNPSQDLLDKVVERISSIDINDKETLSSLKDVTVPTKYRTRYVEKCWEFFETVEAKGVKIKVYLAKFLDQIRGGLLTSLSTSFVTHVIERYFPVVEDRLPVFDYFVVQVLQKRLPERDENFKIVFDLAPKLPNKVLGNFFTTFINVARVIDVDQRFVYTFDKHWQAAFSMVDSFDEHIALKLVLLKFESLVRPEEFAIRSVKYLEQLVEQFGYHVYDNFKANLRDTLCNMGSMEYSFYLGVLKYKVNPTTCILVLDLVNHIVDDDNDYNQARDIYKNIMKILETVETPIVRVQYKAFINKIPSETL